MLRTLNSTRTGSARPSEYTILYSGGHYRIYDKQQRFRCEFATLPAAQAYIASRTAPSTGSGAGTSDNAFLWDGEFSQENTGGGH